MKPNYEHRCSQFCTDRKGKPRTGSQWIHVQGRTLWVCEPCAQSIGRHYGIPTRAQSRRVWAQLMRRGQLGLDLTVGDPLTTARSSQG